MYPGVNRKRRDTCVPGLATLGTTARDRFNSSAYARPGISRPQHFPGSHVIRLDSISKQNGHHLLFVEASAALHRGEKVGLVDPNGAGKTTLFRMITGEEQPDEGQ